MKTWRCAKHYVEVTCHKCGKDCEEHRGVPGEVAYCSDECRFPSCEEPDCREARPPKDKYRFDRMEAWRCDAHTVQMPQL